MPVPCSPEFKLSLCGVLLQLGFGFLEVFLVLLVQVHALVNTHQQLRPESTERNI